MNATTPTDLKQLLERLEREAELFDANSVAMDDGSPRFVRQALLDAAQALLTLSEENRALTRRAEAAEADWQAAEERIAALSRPTPTPERDEERLPKVSHARDCEYVTSDGPAACTCDFYEREQAAIASISPPTGFQERVDEWLLACFGGEIARDKIERNHRFLEEALELVQACGCTASEAHQLVDYTFGRPVGEIGQEVGGVMNTLAALCLAYGLDMAEEGDREMVRCWEKIERIREKQRNKPKHSPLPEALPPPMPDRFDADDALKLLAVEYEAAGFSRPKPESFSGGKERAAIRAITTAHQAGIAEGRELAAAWHDQRYRDTPDAFEMEFHDVSRKAIQSLSHRREGVGK